MDKITTLKGFYEGLESIPLFWRRRFPKSPGHVSARYSWTSHTSTQLYLRSIFEVRRYKMIWRVVKFMFNIQCLKRENIQKQSKTDHRSTLVGGSNHLEKYWSMGRVIPYIMENKKCLKPPTCTAILGMFQQTMRLLSAFSFGSPLLCPACDQVNAWLTWETVHKNIA